MSRYKNPNLNKWIGNDKNGVWEYCYYRYCYLVIMRLDNGKFKPMVGALGDLETPSMPLPKCGYHQFDTFEEAEKFLHKYVDYIRDEWDVKAKEALNARLHRLNPSVFPI